MCNFIDKNIIYCQDIIVCYNAQLSYLNTKKFKDIFRIYMVSICVMIYKFIKINREKCENTLYNLIQR